MGRKDKTYDRNLRYSTYDIKFIIEPLARAIEKDPCYKICVLPIK